MATQIELRDRVVDMFEDLETQIAYDELTVHVPADRLLEVLAWAREDEVVDAELLTDVSGVHWPAGDQVIERQPTTTGWPEYRTSREQGAIEVLYVLRSIRSGHRVRLSVSTPDDDPRVPSSTAVYPNAAMFHEREVHDMFGVDFEGHPDLRRILMPDDWLGHPHRKDYPLGGVEIPYKNDHVVPPPNERDIRQVVRDADSTRSDA